MPLTVYEHILNPKLKRAYSYIMAIRSEGRLPSRADIDPIQMREWLDHVELLDVINDGESFRYRLAGGEIESIFNCSMHGRNLNEIFTGNILDFKLEIFRRCVTERKIILSNDSLERGSSRLLKYERLLVPMSTNGWGVDQLFGCTYPIGKSVDKVALLDPELKITAEKIIEDQY